MLLILDEWIIHDLQGDNGSEKQKESYKFLEKIKEKCDKICWIKAYFYLRQRNIEPIIITTDKKLIETLREHNIPIEHRDDFIRTY
jgi:rRNA-processing protein FCF1